MWSGMNMRFRPFQAYVFATAVTDHPNFPLLIIWRPPRASQPLVDEVTAYLWTLTELWKKA